MKPSIEITTLPWRTDFENLLPNRELLIWNKLWTASIGSMVVRTDSDGNLTSCGKPIQWHSLDYFPTHYCYLEEPQNDD